MNPNLEQTYRRFRAVGRSVLRLGVPALLAVTALTVVASVPTAARTPRIKKPGAPTAVTAIAVNGGAAVSWTAPASDGGSPIIGYTVTAGDQTCATTDVTPCTVTGLKNGRTYTVKVRASNSIGMGKAARVQVTPSNAQNCSYIGPDANLQGCYLARADLINADLTGANLFEANLFEANLFGANLTGASLDAYLEGVSSGGITGTPSSLTEYWSLVDGYLVGPEDNLSGAGLSNVDLTGVDLYDSTLDEADLNGANLTDANLTDVRLAYTDLTGANLTGATLIVADGTGTIWSNTTCPDGTNSDNDGDICVNN
jgi:uncharacterized protein YjbI with pentapeptide repeats